jgi:hypothetical protein
MVAALLVIFGVLGVAGGILAKDFYAADAITLQEFKPKRKIPTWLGRLICIVAGVGLMCIGIKMLVWRCSRLATKVIIRRATSGVMLIEGRASGQRFSENVLGRKSALRAILHFFVPCHLNRFQLAFV